MSDFEAKTQQYAILVIPVIMIIWFHTIAWLVYYCKYYQWDNRDKKDKHKKLKDDPEKTAK